MNHQKKRFSHVFICCLLIAICAGCGEEDVPKPKGYFRIPLPEKKYADYSSEFCPFTFQYPEYAEVIPEKYFFNEPAENPCWMNIDFKALNGKIHLSYKVISEKNNISKLVEDAHKLTFKHTMKADYIDETRIGNRENVSGILYEVGGNAASSVQFFLTDSARHFIRGSLYFNVPPNEDSLMPVIRFVKEDMFRLIETFEWRNEKATSWK